MDGEEPSTQRPGRRRWNKLLVTMSVMFLALSVTGAFFVSGYFSCTDHKHRIQQHQARSAAPEPGRIQIHSAREVRGGPAYQEITIPAPSVEIPEVLTEREKLLIDIVRNMSREELERLRTGVLGSLIKTPTQVYPARHGDNDRGAMLDDLFDHLGRVLNAARAPEADGATVTPNAKRQLVVPTVEELEDYLESHRGALDEANCTISGNPADDFIADITDDFVGMYSVLAPSASQDAIPAIFEALWNAVADFLKRLLGDKEKRMVDSPGSAWWRARMVDHADAVAETRGGDPKNAKRQFGWFDPIDDIEGIIDENYGDVYEDMYDTVDELINGIYNTYSTLTPAGSENVDVDFAWAVRDAIWNAANNITDNKYMADPIVLGLDVPAVTPGDEDADAERKREMLRQWASAFGPTMEMLEALKRLPLPLRPPRPASCTPIRPVSKETQMAREWARVKFEELRRKMAEMPSPRVRVQPQEPSRVVPGPASTARLPPPADRTPYTVPAPPTFSLRPGRLPTRFASAKPTGN